MKRKVFRIETALLLIMTSGAFSFQQGSLQQNPFEEPLLDVRSRVFIRRDAFEGLTVTKLREAEIGIDGRKTKLTVPEWFLKP